MALVRNLYSITTNQAAIAALFRVVNRYVGNLAPMPGVFPDYPAPVVRNTDAARMVLMRWGMPPPPRTGGPPVTNIRNTSSPHWRGWLKPENRCLVPATALPRRGRRLRAVAPPLPHSAPSRLLPLVLSSASRNRVRSACISVSCATLAPERVHAKQHNCNSDYVCVLPAPQYDFE